MKQNCTPFGIFSMPKRIALATLLLFAAMVPAAGADPVTFTFTGSQGGSMGEGSIGNVRTFTSGGITLSVTAWAYTYDLKPGTDNALGAAAVGRWDTGLGACNTTEMPCSSPSHQVDNVGVDDWLLFVFSAPIDISSVRIDPYGNYDRDVSYYVGNVTTPLNLTGKTYSALDELGFSALYSNEASAGDGYRDVAISGGYVNALLLGGYKNSDQDDYFKVKSVTGQTRVPEPSTLLLMLSGSGAVALFRQRRGLRRV
jgi:hypothetical protein